MHLTYFLAGVEGYDSLIEVVGKLQKSTDWIKETKKILQQGKQYFKGDYKFHIKMQSRIPDHCMAYSLSDRNDARLQKHCMDHDHTAEGTVYCDHCEQQKQILGAIQQEVLSSDVQEKIELIYIVGVAIESINEWKAHNMRAVHQDDVKTQILDSLTEDTVFITLDWAMKWLPTKGTESQAEWFGKRGISYHIAVALLKVLAEDGSSEFKTRTFVHTYDQAKQDSKDITAPWTSWSTY